MRRRWRRNRKITVKFVQYAITKFLLNESTRKTLSNDCEAITHKDERSSKMTFYPPISNDEKDKDD